MELEVLEVQTARANQRVLYPVLPSETSSTFHDRPSLTRAYGRSLFFSPSAQWLLACTITPERVNTAERAALWWASQRSAVGTTTYTCPPSFESIIRDCENVDPSL